MFVSFGEERGWLPFLATRLASIPGHPATVTRSHSAPTCGRPPGLWKAQKGQELVFFSLASD